MSVINQMLKDLQQRQDDKPSAEVSSQLMIEENNSTRTTIIIGLVIVVIGLMAFIVWQMYVENQQLKTLNQVKPSLNMAQTAIPSVNETQLINAELTKAELTKAKPNIEEPNKTVLKIAQSNTPQPNTITQHKAKNSEDENLIETDVNTPVRSASAEKLVQNQAKVPPVVVTPLANTKTVLTQNIQDTSNSGVNKPVAVENISTMKVTRRQLSPEELAQQKMASAQKAIAMNDTVKAEQLFEDVLLILPSDKNARKQLAALWFGRQLYQAAHNLLAQGIVLDSSDAELRLLKARIYIKQGLHQPAFNVLKNLAEVETLQHIDYQSLLASEAQKSSHFDWAVQTYQRLINWQGQVGRWLLGLAIAYDSNSEFTLAAQAYNKALVQQDLSNSATQFIKQRLQELGE